MSSEINDIAKKVIENSLLPSKSTKIYNGAYNKFLTWCNKKNIKDYSENTLLVYFYELVTESKWKCSTLWSQYSMLRTVLNINYNVDISKYMKLRAFLKKQNEGYRAKKSKVFTKEQFDKFLDEAPNDKYLGLKVVLIIGISGACRCDELVNLTLNDVESLGSVIRVTIPDSKTNKSRSFTIIGDKYINLYQKYVALRPQDFESRRFFFKYLNGKCCRMVMGIHVIGKIPLKVATYLNLPQPNEYTGHSLRRTSATLLVDGGGDLTCLKRLGGWKSGTVAEGYIEESMFNQNENARKILSSHNVDVNINNDSIHDNTVIFNDSENISREVSTKKGVVPSEEVNFCGAVFKKCTVNINIYKK
ncbi:uncharacterized protein [Onthophagus taurus]|uniref:uncharacterized protein n=1 Tax=Onthophagus taurus TaxID=166361 RepID=UPI0039BE7E68